MPERTVDSYPRRLLRYSAGQQSQLLLSNELAADELFLRRDLSIRLGRVRSSVDVLDHGQQELLWRPVHRHVRSVQAVVCAVCMHGRGRARSNPSHMQFDNEQSKRLSEYLSTFRRHNGQSVGSIRTKLVSTIYGQYHVSR